MRTVNKKLAVLPFPKREVKTVVQKGMAIMEHMVKLEKTKVLFENEAGIPVGSTVYFPGDVVKLKESSQVFKDDIGGAEFILLSQDLVVAVE